MFRSIASSRISRKAVQSLQSFSTNAVNTASAMPTVADVTVKLTFVDPTGARRIVPGYVGKNIHETCLMHGIDIGPSSTGGLVENVRSDTWTEPLYGEGTNTGFDHILISGKGADTAKPMDWVEERVLKEYWEEDEIFAESRLASQVTLTKEMDGMVVYVPDRLVDDCP